MLKAMVRSGKKSTGLNRYLDLFQPLRGHSDIAFAVAICGILAVLFVPLPAILLDIGLAMSFAVSIMVLMVAIWVNKPLEFNSFPTLLLVVTVMRLALSVASTRLILSEGQNGTDAAGHVIEGIAFFVVGGDYIIGAIIFSILVAINFIVITKGSTRIAEVSARFSLDAMPGKQMAIDADLGAGLIDDVEARRRRQEVEGESGFFGAMDGAAKFVRGDAVAGIIITFVNILGGLLIGVIRHGMDFGSAAQTYTVLTIGDGLVNQIPALIVSIAAGLIVAKGAAEGSASKAVTGQLVGSPKALYASAALVAGLAILPGFPFFIFISMAILLATMGLLSSRHAEDGKRAEAMAAQQAKAAEESDSKQKPKSTGRDAICLDLGANLVMLIDDRDSALSGKVVSLRGHFVDEFGFSLPSVKVQDSNIIDPSEYSITFPESGLAPARGKIVPGARLVIDPENACALPGVRVKEPSFGLSALWINAGQAAEAEMQGFSVVDAETVIITHFTEVVRDRMSDLLTYGATEAMIKTLDKDYQKLLSGLALPTPGLTLCSVLRRLLDEKVSIANLPLIIEGMAEITPRTKNDAMITEHVRQKLSAQICSKLSDKNDYMPVIVLGGIFEERFRSLTTVTPDEILCPMKPSDVREFVLAARKEIEVFAVKDEFPALLVAPNYRPTILSMMDRISPNTQIISHSEVHRKTKIRVVATIGD